MPHKSELTYRKLYLNASQNGRAFTSSLVGAVARP